MKEFKSETHLMKERKKMSKEELIQEWLNDHYDELSPEELIDYYWFNDKLLEVLDYEESWVDIEKDSKLDFLDFDEIKNNEDKKALKLLQNSRILSIEENWKNISEKTIIYIRDKKANIRAKINLKDLITCLELDKNDLRKTLNLFLDSNNIVDLDINIKNRYLEDEYLPKELKWYKQSPTYNNSKNVA